MEFEEILFIAKQGDKKAIENISTNVNQKFFNKWSI